MKTLLLVLALFSLNAQAEITTLSLPKNSRFVWGWENNGVTNLFVSGIDAKNTCSLNLLVSNNELLASFQRGYENQVVYRNFKTLNLEKQAYDAKITPFRYEYCAEYEDSYDDDRECLRYETATGQYESFSFVFTHTGLQAEIACVTATELNPEAQAKTEQEAESYLRLHTNFF